MPLYVYACAHWDVEVEELRPASQADDPLACPVCQAACVRAPTSFGIGGRAGPSTGSSASRPHTSGPSHAAACGCCAPRRR